MSKRRRAAQDEAPARAAPTMDEIAGHGAAAAGADYAFSQAGVEDVVARAQAPPQAVQDERVQEGRALERERKNAEKLPTDELETLICRSTRYLMLKALNQEPIDKTKLISEVLTNYKKLRITSYILHVARERLRKQFGIELVKAPESRFPRGMHKNALYAVNTIRAPDHCVELNDNEEAPSRGLLMVTLSFIWCNNHKISEKQLLEQIARLDDRAPVNRADDRHPLNDVGRLLENFRNQHYLIRTKTEDAHHDPVFMFEIGPRAYVEIGRKQIVTFIAECQGQSVDKALLAQIEAEDSEDHQAAAAAAPSSAGGGGGGGGGGG